MYSCNSNCGVNETPKMAYIDVLNYGGFIARFWGTYDYNGSTVNFSVDGFPIGQERRVNIPIGATNIHVVMEDAVFLEAWQLICEKTYSVADEYCFVVYGLTFAAYCAEVPCTSPGLLKSIFPTGVFIAVDPCNNLMLNNRSNCVDIGNNGCCFNFGNIGSCINTGNVGSCINAGSCVNEKCTNVSNNGSCVNRKCSNASNSGRCTNTVFNNSYGGKRGHVFTDNNCNR